ncbi:MAG: response regulator [Gemmatimonadota bacterium]
MGRVLVVDDNADERLIYSAVLKHHGHEVEQAGDGAGAVELARSFKPDAILMDVHMPVMDGLLASQLLRAQADTAGIPILCVTGYDIHPSQAAAAGCNGFLRKPIPPRMLLDAVAALLGQQADQGPSST